jgi:hypothetical protein
MSGGAVIDEGGALVGIIPRGWGDGGPPSTAGDRGAIGRAEHRQ